MNYLKNGKTVPYLLGLLLSITMAVVIRLVVGSQFLMDAIGSYPDLHLVPVIGLVGILLTMWFGSLELAADWLGDRIDSKESYIAKVSGFLAVVLGVSFRVFPQKVSHGHLQETTLIIIIAILLGVFVLFGAAISEEVIHKELMKDEPEEEKKRERRPGKTGSIMTTSPMRRSRVRRLR
jgi:hypothetical protein